MHGGLMGELQYMSASKNNACFNCYDIKQSITQTSKNCTLLNFTAHKEYKNLYIASID